MKTAVSIPDPVFRAADELAQRLGMSRSGLFAAAVRKYVEEHDDDAITAKVDEVLSREPSSLAPELQSIQARSIPREPWK